MTDSDALDIVHRPDIRAKIRHMKQRRRKRTAEDGSTGLQALIEFTNGYSLSVINDGGFGVEAMIMGIDDETITNVPDSESPGTPPEAAGWIASSLAIDLILPRLSPQRLEELVADVANWNSIMPEIYGEIGPERIGVEIRSINPKGFRSGQWGKITGTTVIKGRACWEITWPDGIDDQWPMVDPSDQREFRDGQS